MQLLLQISIHRIKELHPAIRLLTIFNRVCKTFGSVRFLSQWFAQLNSLTVGHKQTLEQTVFHPRVYQVKATERPNLLFNKPFPIVGSTD